MGREGGERGEGRERGTRQAGARRRRGRGRRARGAVTRTTPPSRHIWGVARSSGAHATYPRAAICADPSWKDLREVGCSTRHKSNTTHHPPITSQPYLRPPPLATNQGDCISARELLQLAHSLASAGGKALRPAGIPCQGRPWRRPPAPPALETQCIARSGPQNTAV